MQVALLSLLMGCPTPPIDPALDADADTDADSDTDSDTEPDADSDTDSGDSTADTAAGLPLPGWGLLSGACDALDDGEWTSMAPALFRNTLDLTGLVWDPDASVLSPGGQQILDEGTLGGSSGESEALAYDVLFRCEGAILVLTETTIDYVDDGGKKTDLLAEIDGRSVGVSVTRALTYVDPEQRCGPVVQSDVTDLITDKIRDLPLSEANAAASNPWERSLLAVMACDPAHADAVQVAWDSLDPVTLGDTLLIVTVTEGVDDFIYD